MINRILLVIFASLFLASCGGGGGGGGGTTNSTGSDNNTGADNNTGGNDSTDQGGGDEQQAEPFVQQQSEYLPLIAGRGWSYEFDPDPADEDLVTRVSVPLRVSEYDGADDLFVVSSAELDYGGSENATINQVLRSTPESVEIVRFDIEGFVLTFPNPLFQGSTVDVTINSLDFGESSLQLIPGSEAKTVISNLTVGNIPVFGTATFALDSTLSVTNSAVVEPVNGWGNLPLLKVVAELHIDDNAVLTEAAQFPVELTLRETALFAPGIGPVARKIEFIEGDPSMDPMAQIDMNLSGLLDLPEPVIYQMTTGDPALSSDAYIDIGGIDLTSTEYSILNADSFGSGENDWIEIEVTNNNLFNVIVSATGLTPEEATSKVIYVGQSGSDVQIPVNVTLVTAPNDQD